METPWSKEKEFLWIKQLSISTHCRKTNDFATIPYATTKSYLFILTK